MSFPNCEPKCIQKYSVFNERKNIYEISSMIKITDNFLPPIHSIFEQIFERDLKFQSKAIQSILILKFILNVFLCICFHLNK